MVTITAIIRARPNAQDIVRYALLSVVEAVRETEPQTGGYFVTQSVDDQCVSTTFERFADRIAMERHNASPALVRFLQRTRLHLDGDVVIHVSEEIASR
jgi:quinol monooxygenase YgiN